MRERAVIDEAWRRPEGTCEAACRHRSRLVLRMAGKTSDHGVRAVVHLEHFPDHVGIGPVAVFFPVFVAEDQDSVGTVGLIGRRRMCGRAAALRLARRKKWPRPRCRYAAPPNRWCREGNSSSDVPQRLERVAVVAIVEDFLR